MESIISIVIISLVGLGFFTGWLKQTQAKAKLKASYEEELSRLTAEKLELEHQSAANKDFLISRTSELSDTRSLLDEQQKLANDRHLEIATLRTENKNLEETLLTRTAELSTTRRSLEEQQGLTNACNAEIATLKTQNRNWEEQLQIRTAELVEARRFLEEQQSLANARKLELTTLQTNNRNLEEKLSTQKAEIEELQKRLTAEFENIATRILKERTENFSNTTQRQIGAILDPLKERIKDFEQKVDKTYNEETREKASLKEVINQIIKTNQQMSAEAQKLTRALKGDSKTQGDWGEMQLELLLEKTGLQRDIHYKKQENFKTENGGNVRPDYVIYLPDNKQFVIDSKVSLTAYERYFNAESEEERALHLREHIASVTKHISDLSAKNYQNLYGINSLDYVFLFVALEPALNLVLHNDLTIFDKAMSKNIVLVSASTLWATMRTVSFIWKQENQNKNARDIAKESGALYDKFTNFMSDLISLGKQLDSSKGNYEEAMNKLFKSPKKGDTIMGRIERIKELGANTTKSLPQSLLDRIE